MLQSNESPGDAPARSAITSSSWRPMYLTPASLAVFSVVFLACLASVQALLAISNRHTGFSGDSNSLHRVLWSYGPVAILTLVSSFWVRLEIQTKTTASWSSMARGNTAACQSLLLDYTSQFQPISIVSALRYKDYTVAAATVVSILLKVLLVLATSLITLSPATIVKTQDVSLILESQFIDKPNGLRANGSLAAANFALMMNFNTLLPQGVSDTYAYQLIESDLLDTPSTLNTTVDGFLGGLECEPANLGWNRTESYSMPIMAGSCSFQVILGLPKAYSKRLEDGDHVVDLQSGTCDGSDSKDGQRLAIIAAVVAFPTEDILTIAKSNSLLCTPTYQILPLDLSAQGPDRLLQPSPGGDSRLLENVHAWDIMDALLHESGSSENSYGGSGVNISHQPVWFDQFGYRAYQFANTSGNTPTLSTIFEDPAGLTEFFTNYYRQYSALLAHSSLMQPASISSKGSADAVKSRFLGMPVSCILGLYKEFPAKQLEITVQRPVADSMTALSAACFMIGMVIWIIRASTKLTLPQNPTTIMGLAKCLSLSYAIVETFSGMGSSGRDNLQAVLDGCYYRSSMSKNDGSFAILAEERLLPNDDLEMWPPEQSVFKPMSLKFSVRLAAVTILLAIIISLEVTLRLSERDQGLGDVPRDSKIISYFWTALPGLIFTLIGIYCSSVDFDTRSLVPFLHLVRGSGFMSSVDLDLVTKHTFLLLYEELRTKSFETLASTLAVTLTSFLTIFSTGLFTSVIGNSNVLTELSVANPIWYNKPSAFDIDWPDYPLNTAALILASNLSYPSFTYEDLILPTLEVDKTFLSAHTNTSAVKFSTTILAARPSFSQCRIFNSSQIYVNFTKWHDFGVRVHINSEECQVYAPDFSGNLNILMPTGPEVIFIEPDSPGLLPSAPEPLPLPPEAYFGIGAGTSSLGGSSGGGCSQRLWAWGRWSTWMAQQGGFPQVLSVSALACNASVETVEVDALLFGADLTINPSRPPIPHPSAISSVDMRSWFEGPESVTRFTSELYDGLPPLSTNMTDRLFDTFFTLLTTSRYAIPLDMLGNQSHASTVAESIKFHHNIIAAQKTASIIDSVQLVGNESMRDRGYEIVPGTNDTSSYNCTSSVPLDRPRVVQNAFSTRVLQGLLTGVLICSLINWYLIYLAGGCGVIPRSPNTIANVAALLADGNLIDRLRSVNGQSLDSQAVRDHLGRDTVFRLGWREIPGREEQVYCIYADDGSREAAWSHPADESEGTAVQDDA